MRAWWFGLTASTRLLLQTVEMLVVVVLLTSLFSLLLREPWHAWPAVLWVVLVLLGVRAWLVEHLWVRRRRPGLPPLPPSRGSDGTAVLDVRRGADGSGRGRRLRVLLDGRVVADLDRGGHLQLLVTPGTHDLRVASGWTDSPTVRVEVRDGDAAAATAAVGPDAWFDQWWRPWQALTLDVQPPERSPEAAARDAERQEAHVRAARRAVQDAPPA